MLDIRRMPPPTPSVANTSRLPSGDQSGFTSGAGDCVSGTAFPPSTGSSQMSSYPDRSELYAILNPSGDHAGSVCTPLSNVNCQRTLGDESDPGAPLPPVILPMPMMAPSRTAPAAANSAERTPTRRGCWRRLAGSAGSGSSSGLPLFDLRTELVAGAGDGDDVSMRAGGVLEHLPEQRDLLGQVALLHERHRARPREGSPPSPRPGHDAESA